MLHARITCLYFDWVIIYARWLHEWNIYCALLTYRAVLVGFGLFGSFCITIFRFGKEIHWQSFVTVRTGSGKLSLPGSRTAFSALSWLRNLPDSRVTKASQIHRDFRSPLAFVCVSITDRSWAYKADCIHFYDNDFFCYVAYAMV